MSNTSSAVILFAPAGTGKTDFLSELATRYSNVFWFNGLSVNINIFAQYLIDQIIGENDVKLRNKLNQLLYCRADYNGDKVVMPAVLDYISNIKGNCLMVFERMEALSDDFDLKNIETIIKHCPPNLKIVVSSDKFINFDYTAFEPLCPKLIDETILVPKLSEENLLEQYLENLSDDDKAFLTYFSNLEVADFDFIETIYNGGSEILKYLSRKSGLVVVRDKNECRMNVILKDYLQTLKPKYQKQNEQRNKICLKTLYAEYLFKKEKLTEAFEAYSALGDCKMLDKIVLEILSKRSHRMRSFDLAKSVQFDNVAPIEGLNYYNYFCGIVSYFKGDFKGAREIFRKVYRCFKEEGNLWMQANAIGIQFFMPQNSEEFKDESIALIKEIKEKSIENLDVLLTPIIKYRKELEITFAEIEEILENLREKGCQLYILKKEFLAYCYFELGNYKKALEITQEIKEYVHWYVIPHNFISFRYFDGEIAEAERQASSALTFALQNDIAKEISLLYSTLAMIDLYYDKVDEALAKHDKAVSFGETDCSRTKFYNISMRCMAYAKHKDANYAKEVSHIYLKYCEIFEPTFANMMMLSLSFAYLKLNEREKAYQYATKCVQASSSKTVHWLVGMAIATNYMLTKGDLKDAGTLIGNILKSSYTYGLEMLLVDYYNDIFEPLIKYARLSDVETEYLDKIEWMLKDKNLSRVKKNSLKVTMFGDVTVSVDGVELLWKTKKSKELFTFYLLNMANGMDRTYIINVLWKDYVYESAINNLKTTNNIIRKTLLHHGIEFSLDYMNAKYILKLSNLESDYVTYCELREKYNHEVSLTQKVKLMHTMLKLYKNDFALDIYYKDFNDERRSLKAELTFMLLKLVKRLAKHSDYLEAKQFLSTLILIDNQNDYSSIAEELDSRINLTN
jgi:tetratricopeptide (TPR) repeat protein